MAYQPSFGKLGADVLPIDPPFSDSPFRIAVLADFSGRANRGLDGSAGDIAERRLLRTDRANFDANLAKFNAKLKLPLDNGKTAEAGFATFEDFHADGLFKNVERFSDLDEQEERSNLMTALLHHPDFRTVEAAWRGLDWLLRRVQ